MAGKAKGSGKTDQAAADTAAAADKDQAKGTGSTPNTAAESGAPAPHEVKKPADQVRETGEQTELTGANVQRLKDNEAAKQAFPPRAGFPGTDQTADEAEIARQHGDQVAAGATPPGVGVVQSDPSDPMSDDYLKNYKGVWQVRDLERGGSHYLTSLDEAIKKGEELAEERRKGGDDVDREEGEDYRAKWHLYANEEPVALLYEVKPA